jgi:hypothetical protein
MGQGLDPPWNLVLADWFNCGADVTIVLKNGEKFEGRVASHPTNWLDNTVTLTNQYGNIHHTIDRREIAAITAVGRP